MQKKDLRLFFCSFFITLILTGWLAVFLVVDRTSSKFSNGKTAPALQLVRSDELHYDMALMGEWYTLTLEPIQELEAWREQYACLVTPRRILTAEKLYAWSACGLQKLYDWYREQAYLQNVAKET